MALHARTRYAKCGELDGEIDIAYQTIGDGPRDLVVLSPVLITIDSVKAEPSMDRFHRRLASFGRVIRLDHRGTGLSSHVPAMDRVAGPKYWAEDVIAVMEAAGSEQAVFLVSGLAASTGLFLAANYPDKVSGLVIVNGTARLRWAPDYPVGAEEALITPLTTVAMDPDAVGLGFDALELLAPTVAKAEVFRTWWDEAGNRAASPSMARAVAEVAADIDVRDSLSHITAPTLILHRADCRFLGPGHGRYLAEHIAQSRYMELPGTDMLYWVGDSEPLLEEIEEFVTGERGGVEGDRRLAVLLFTDIVSSTQRAAALGDLKWRDLLDSHDNLIRHQLRRFGGREINTTGDGFVAMFTGPGAAINCAKAIVDAVRSLAIEVRAGIHVGEIELRGDDVAGMAVHIGARVAALAGPNEVLVSSTVQQIVAGSNRVFRERGMHDLKGVPGRWQLYSV